MNLGPLEPRWILLHPLQIIILIFNMQCNFLKNQIFYAHFQTEYSIYFSFQVFLNQLHAHVVAPSLKKSRSTSV